MIPRLFDPATRERWAQSFAAELERCERRIAQGPVHPAWERQAEAARERLAALRALPIGSAA